MKNEKWRPFGLFHFPFFNFHYGLRRAATLQTLCRNFRTAFFPANVPLLPRASSIRSSWLYLAVRSLRLAEPVLIWPALVATARSAMVASSVSPDRCEMI